MIIASICSLPPRQVHPDGCDWLIPSLLSLQAWCQSYLQTHNVSTQLCLVRANHETLWHQASTPAWLDVPRFAWSASWLPARPRRHRIGVPDPRLFNKRNCRWLDRRRHSVEYFCPSWHCALINFSYETRVVCTSAPHCKLRRCGKHESYRYHGSGPPLRGSVSCVTPSPCCLLTCNPRKWDLIVVVF